MVELRVLSTGYHRSEGSGFGVDPGDRNCLKRGSDIERHAHLPGDDWPFVGEKDGVEQLKDEITRDPAHRNLPLKRPNFCTPSDAMFSRIVSQQTEEEMPSPV